MNYATVSDVIALFRALTPDETDKAEQLIPVVSARIREAAKNVGKNFDEMIAGDNDLSVVAKSVTVDVVARCLMTPTNQAPMSQFSESGLGYTVSGTFTNPGGGIFIKDAELRALGIKRQRYGVIDFYCGEDSNGCH